ncbi:Dimer-Tnp-hAT domain-containing protein [Mycena sanguinolenta]|uniref:Dimer-Tnp-hAT domain-containing protein n=1 Tax=Mycena sanguinolenta TaxID=230812 RepID=A0A8H7DKL8_9AGAR|nr:Dimer-Tnp-hAT domain-containing protein [Mycena sanguinolenta]
MSGSGKPTRARTAPKHLVDGSNSEAPNAAHQAIVDATQARLNAAAAIAKLIQNIEDLDALLPTTVAEGTEDDEIHRVLTTIQGLDPDSPSSTFTRRFDILFKEDAQCRDADGRLHLIRRGELGMLMVVRYLREVKWSAADMNLEGAVLKLERVVKEMEILCDMDRSAARAARKSTSTSAPKPKAKAKSTAETPAESANSGQAEKEAMLDEIFDAIMSGKKRKNDDNAYRPRKKDAELSEEEDDDFVEGENFQEPASTGKRKLIVVDGVTQPPPRRRFVLILSRYHRNHQRAVVCQKKKSKTKGARAAPPPNVDVIEVDDESEDEVGATGKRGPTTETRDHFHPPVAVKLKGEKRWAFKCRHCKTTLTFSRSVGKNQLFGDEKPAPPLGNLATHITSKHDGVPVPSDVQPGEIRGVSATSAKIMADFLLEGKLNPAINSTQKNFLKVFAAWIIEDDLPFTTGETPGIQRLFAFLQTRYGLPSDTTNVKSKIAVATDTWTTRAMTFTFAGTIASWITADWELVERVLDFHPIEDKEHEGEYAALGLAKSLNNFKALEKISHIFFSKWHRTDGSLYLFAVALDNASPNDVLLQALSRLLMRKFDIQFVPANSQIRCLAHVVNLVVQKFLAALDDAEDPENIAIPEVIAMEQEVFTEQPGEENEEDDAADLLADLSPEFANMSVLQKLRTTATKICSSPQRRKRFRDTAVRVLGGKLTTSGRPLASLMVVRDVRHRWNYTEAMIERGVMLQKAIDTWVLDRPELRPLWLKAEDWKFLESLGEKFTEVTKEMSRSRTPTLPWVLPMYEGMRKHLRGTMDTATYPSLRTAAGAALDKLESYYSKACNSELNIVATLLHPSLGISWFRKLDPAHQLSAAHAQVLFEHVYDSYRRTPVDTPRQPSAPTPPSRSTSFLDDICMVDVPDISKPTVTVLTELERFWIAFDNYSGPPNGTLKWWKEHEHEFPIISKIARDFLAIPGTTVSVERLFSIARMRYGTASRARYLADLYAPALCFPTVPAYDLRCILARAPFLAAAQEAIQILLDVDSKSAARKEALVLLGIPAPRAEHWARSDAQLTFALTTMLGPEPAYLAAAQAQRPRFSLPPKRKRQPSQLEDEEVVGKMTKKKRRAGVEAPPVHPTSPFEFRPSGPVPSIRIQPPTSPAANINSTESEQFYTCPKSTSRPVPAPASHAPPIPIVISAAPPSLNPNFLLSPYSFPLFEPHDQLSCYPHPGNSSPNSSLRDLTSVLEPKSTPDFSAPAANVNPDPNSVTTRNGSAHESEDEDVMKAVVLARVLAWLANADAAEGDLNEHLGTAEHARNPYPPTTENPTHNFKAQP